MIAEILPIIFIFIPWIGIYIVDAQIEDTMSIREEQKIIKLFKKFGIEQCGNGINRNNRYTVLYGIIGDRDKEVRIEVRKKKFKIVFEIEPDLSMQKELDVSLVKIRTIKNFNKVFKNGIIEYFEERIKMKKLKNKLNRIEGDFK